MNSYIPDSQFDVLLLIASRCSFIAARVESFMSPCSFNALSIQYMISAYWWMFLERNIVSVLSSVNGDIGCVSTGSVFFSLLILLSFLL